MSSINKKTVKSFTGKLEKIQSARESKPKTRLLAEEDHAQIMETLSRNFAYLSVDFEEGECENSAKEYAQTAWDSKQTKREEHIREAYKLAVSKDRKAQKRRSARGRRIVNHAFETPSLIATAITDKERWNELVLDFYRYLRALPEKCAASFDAANVEVTRISVMFEMQEQKFDIVSVGLQLSSFVIALGCCENWKQVSAASLQMVTACVGTFHLSQTLVDLVTSVTSNCESWIEDQADFVGFANAMRNIQACKLNLDSIPVYNQLTRLCVLGSLFGLLPRTVHTEGVISRAYEAWIEHSKAKTVQENWVDMIFETMAFASEFIGLAINGCVGKLFRPYGATERALQLQSLAVHFSNGVLAEFDTTEEAYAADIDSCLDALRIERAGKSFSLRNFYDRNISELLRIKNLVHASMSIAKKRNPPPIFILYGASQIGKSAIMFQLATYFGRQFGFPHEERNFWFPAKGDEYDSGYTGNTTIIIDDDMACEKPDKAPTKAAFDFLRYCNVIPYTTVQAELDKKGVIRFTHKVVIGSTNVKDLALHHHMATPSAGFNRAYFYHVVVKSQYTGVNGKLDVAKMKDALRQHEIRIPEDVYLFHRYELREETKGVTQEYVRSNMSYGEFLLDARALYVAHEKKGAEYLNMIEKFHVENDCPLCALPKRVCCCKNIEDEAFGNVLMDVTSTAFVMLSNITAWIPDPNLWVVNRILPPLYNLLATQTFTTFIEVVGVMMVRGMYLVSLFLRRNVVVAMWLMAGLYPIAAWLIAGQQPHWFFSRYIFWVWVFLNWCFSLRIKHHIARTLARTFLDQSMASRLMLNLGAAGVALASGYTAINAIRAAARMLNHGALNPRTQEDVAQRNAEQNTWLVAKPNVLVMERSNLCGMTPEQARRKIAANTVYVQATTREGTNFCSNGLMVKTNVIMMPNHVAEKIDTSKPVVIIRDVKSVGHRLEDVYLSNYTRLVDYPEEDMSNKDAAMFTMSRCITFADITEFFPPEFETASTKCTMITRGKEGVELRRTLLWDFNPMANNESYRGPGSFHKCNVHTERGECMSPIVRDTTPNYIIGYHCGGSPAGTFNPISAAFAVNRTQIESTLKRMKAQRDMTDAYIGPAIISHSVVLGDQYGVQTQIDEVLHARDCVNYVSEENTSHSVLPIGSIPRKRFQRYSEVCISPLSEYLEKEGLSNKWGKPKFNANRNHAAAFQTLINPIRNVPEKEMSVAVKDYLDPILAEFKRLDFKAQPLTMEQVVNGDPARKFVRRMNLNTSPGYGLKAPKKEHFVLLQSDPRDLYAPTQIVLDEFHRAEFMMRAGISPGHIFVSALKDEPTPTHKDKVRVFEVSPLTLVMLVRKYALPLIQHLYMIPFVTEMAQGINCTNDEWDQLGRHISSKDPKRCIEGDFSGYDLRQSGQAIRAVGYILRRIALQAGYSTADADMLEVITNEISFKTYLFNGSLFSIDGSNPSGVPITILINGMINSLLHRIAWYRLWRENTYFRSPKPFQSGVAFATVGDDSVGSTNYSWFNMRNIQKVMADLNMPYTDGHKNPETVEFFPFSDIAFCKRTWRYDDRMKKFVAPIALDSIMKSLHCYMKSRTIVDDIMVQNLNGAFRELARHDRATFEEYSNKLRRACAAMDFTHLVKSIDYSYDDWYSILKEDYVSPGSGDLLDSTDEGLVEEVCDVLITNHGLCEPRSACVIDSTSHVEQTDALTPHLNNYRISKNTNININSSSGGTRIKNVSFNDSTETWHTIVPVNRDATYDAAVTGDQVQDFLQRPVKIYSGEWGVGQSVSVDIDPWTSFFEDPRVFERLKYFRHVRADMHVKVVVNGNPFYSGLCLLSYLPLPSNDSRTLTDNLTQLSQMPHAFLMPTHSTGAEMTLPFFHYNNTLITIDKEWRAMGKLLLRSVVPLAHANGGTDSITITVYAAAVNVSLTTPTGIVPTASSVVRFIENQGDEYGKPSAIAHSVANAAGSLFNVPIIGPYARATQMIASGLGSMAELFGYSRPRCVPEAKSMRLRFQANMAVTNVEDNVASLAIDAKKEITIDPRVVGLEGKDEMALVPIAMRPSYLTTVNVTPDAAAGAHLMSIKCTPMLGNTVPPSTTTYAPSPAAFVTIPFKYWKGTCKIRAIIVASAYHKGRLRFVWDPEYNSAANAEIYNTNYSTVVDISETTDITLDIGWGRNTTYLMHGGLASMANNFSIQPYTERDAFVNGVLSVYVVNPITSPGATTTGISICFFNSMCEDFEVACPDSSAFNAVTVPPYTNSPLNPPTYTPTTPSEPSPTPPPVVPPVDYTDMNPLAFFNTTQFISSSGRGSTARPNYSVERYLYGNTNTFDLDLPFNTNRPNAPIKYTFRYTAAAAAPSTAFAHSWSINDETTKVDGTSWVLGGGGANTWYRDLLITPPQQYGVIRLNMVHTSEFIRLSGFAVCKAFGTLESQTETWTATATTGAAVTTSVSGSDYITDITFTNATGEVVVDLPAAKQFVLPKAFCLYTRGSPWEGGRVFGAQLVTDRGRSSIAECYAQFNPRAGMDSTNSYKFPDLGDLAGATWTGIVFKTIGTGTTTIPHKIKGMSWFKPPAAAVLQDSPVIENQGDETPSAPVDTSTDENMGPACPLASANHVHFGEQITSWRQVLKRYVTKYTATTSGLSTILNDVAPRTGVPLQVQSLPLYEYVRAAYVGYRGSVRVKVIVTSNGAGPILGDARITRVSYGALINGTYDSALKNINWDGTVWEPITHTNTIDAEIPFYSQLRFLPARYSSADNAPSYMNTRMGRERLYFGLQVRPQVESEVNVAQAIGEDFSLHFFLSAPILKTG